jgi:hypothetical protein
LAVFKVVTILILTALPVGASTSDRVVVRENVSAEHRDELVDPCKQQFDQEKTLLVNLGCGDRRWSKSGLLIALIVAVANSRAR